MRANDVEAVPHVPEADSFQVRASLDAIRHAVRTHLGLIVLITLAAVGLVSAYVWVWPPIYQSEIMVAADSDKDTQRTAFYQGWNVFRRDSLADEATLMTAQPILEEVVRRLHLRYDDVYHPFTNYVIHLWGESWIGRHYRRVKALLFPQPPNPYAPTPEQIAQYEVLRDFKEGVSVRQIGEASIGLLTVNGSNQRVSEIANAIVDVYLEQRRARFLKEAEQAYASLHEEHDKAMRDLDQLDKELEKFRADNGMLLLFEKDRVQIGQWVELRAAITELQAQIAEGTHALEVVDGQLARESRSISSDTMFKANAYKERLAKLELELAAARQLYRPDSKEVRDVEQQIAIAQAGLDHGAPTVVRNTELVSDSYEKLRAKKLALEAQLAGARASLAVKTAAAARMQEVLDRIPRNMQLNHEFERRQTTLEAKAGVLNEKLTVAAVSMASAESAPSALRVVEYASPPEQPVWPKTKLLLLAAALLGLTVGSVLALVLELVFVRVNRYRLWGDDDYRVFAIVQRDERVLERLYPRPRNARAAASGDGA